MVYIPDREATPANGGVYLAKVTRITGTTCYVEIASLAPGYEYGPAPYPSDYGPTEEVVHAGAHTHSTSDGPTGTAGDHVHRVRKLAAGDAVAVAFLGGAQDDGVVVLVRLA